MAKISKTWWGTQFMIALEQFLDQGRLKRGRSYRTPHRITSFEITDNHITAIVRGNMNPYFGVYEEPFYEVEIIVTPITMVKWKKIIKDLASHADWVSKLVMNEMPGDIEEAFRLHGVYFLPAKSRDLTTTCTCPDYANPCKHIAGVYFRVASMLDHDPFLMFRLRGMSPEELNRHLSESPLGQALISNQQEAGDVVITPDPERAPRERDIPADMDYRAFWTGQWAALKKLDRGIAGLRVSEPIVPGILVKKQGDYPAFWESDYSFIGTMEEIYGYVRKKNKKSL